MGVIGLNKNYFKPNIKLINCNDLAQTVVVDGNFFWMKKIAFNSAFSLSDTDIFRKFSLYLINDMLKKLINFDRKNKKLILVFDNSQARRVLKHKKCLKNKKYSKNTIPFNLSEFKNEFTATMKNYTNIDYQILEADYDADSLILNILNSEENQLISASFKIDDENIIENTKISTLFLFSGDSDFLAHFSDVQKVSIINEIGGNIYLSNIITDDLEPKFSLLDRLLNKICTKDQIRNSSLFLKMFAANSPNDYLTCNYFETELYLKFLYNFSMNYFILSKNIVDIYSFVYFGYWNYYIKERLTQKRHKMKALINNSLSWLVYDDKYDRCILFDLVSKQESNLKSFEELNILLHDMIVFFFQNIDEIEKFELTFKNLKKKIDYIYLNNIVCTLLTNENISIEKTKLCFLLYKISLFSICSQFNVWFPNCFNEDNTIFLEFKSKLENLFIDLSGYDNQNFQLQSVYIEKNNLPKTLFYAQMFKIICK